MFTYIHLMTTPKVTLKDLIPQSAEFEIAGGEMIQIRPSTVDDWAWMQEKFGATVEDQLAKGLEVDKLMITIYRLMSDEDKRRFPPSEVDEFDDDGNEKKNVKKTGPEMLRSKIEGMSGLQKAIAAFQTSLGVGDRVAEILAMTDGSGAVRPIEKKTQNRATRRAVKRTGQKSTTSSPANTDTPLKTSAS